MLTVGSLLSECGLELVAGGPDGAEEPVRWVHISEHEDPTPWLSGGELLLTTGYNLGTAAKQRRYVELLAGKGLAGLGFGVGFDHKRIPKAIVEGAREHRLALFEVPYEMPFIAINERAAAHLVNEHYDVLERGVQVHEQLERLVIEGDGLDEIVISTAGAVAGVSLVQDGSGHELARHPRRGGLDAKASAALATEIAEHSSNGAPAPFAPAVEALAERALCVPVPGPPSGAPVAWLTVISDDAPLGEFERLIARQAAMVVGLELMRERVVRETERRLAGDLLSDALGERLDAEELRGRLRPFGIGGEAAVLVFELDDPPAAEGRLERALADAGVPALVATTAAAGRPLLCAVVDTGDAEPVGAARAARRELSGGRAETASAPRPAGRHRWARCGARSTRPGARSRRPRWSRATRPRSPRIATWGRSPCCSRSRTTTRCGSTATGCSTRSSAPRASTAASSCARSRPSSRTTATGSARRASSTATATRSATGSARSRSSPGAT